MVLMGEDYNILTVYDSDSDEAPLQHKSRRQRKSTAGKRKIQHIWTDEEIILLIACVEQHRGLWDLTSPEYKLTKLEGWRSVVGALALDGVDIREAKVKWSSLRATFMFNLSKLRRKKSGQGTNESLTVPWKYFKRMMFLEEINKENFASSTSTLKLEDYDNHCSIAEELTIPSSPSGSQGVVSHQCKRSRSITYSPPPPPSPSPPAESSSSQAISIVNSAVATLHSSDTNSTFCYNLLAELQTLSEQRARTLRYKISRLMMDFIESSQELSPI